jgi:hypothetical protein
MLDFFVYFSCSVFDQFADRPFDFNTHTLPMHYHSFGVLDTFQCLCACFLAGTGVYATIFYEALPLGFTAGLASRGGQNLRLSFSRRPTHEAANTHDLVFSDGQPLGLTADLAPRGGSRWSRWSRWSRRASRQRPPQVEEDAPAARRQGCAASYKPKSGLRGLQTQEAQARATSPSASYKHTRNGRRGGRKCQPTKENEDDPARGHQREEVRDEGARARRNDR